MRGLRLKSCQNPTLFQWILSQALQISRTFHGDPEMNPWRLWARVQEPIAWKKSDEVLLELEWIGYQVNTEKIIIYHRSFQHLPTFQTFQVLSPFLPPGKTPCHPSPLVPRCAKLLRWALQGFPASSGSSRWHRLAGDFSLVGWGNHGEKHCFTMKIRGFTNKNVRIKTVFFEIWGKLRVWFPMPFGISFTYWILLVCVVKVPFIN